MVALSNVAEQTAAAAPLGAAVYRLPGRCTLADVAALREDLLLQLDSGQQVYIDAAAVQQIDTAGLQLLCAFAQDLAAAGRPLQWQAVTTTLREAAAAVGLVTSLNLTVSPGVA